MYYFLYKVLKVTNQYIFIMHRDVPLMYDEFNYKLKKQPLIFLLGGCLDETKRLNHISI